MRVEPFQIEQQETTNAYLLSLRGELDLSVVPQLRAVLEPVVHQTDRALILNLQDLTYIDSTGIGIIVSVLKIRDGLNAPFAVQHIPPSIKRLFDLTGISAYLTEGTENKA
ncbi:STAS domain-containing protein [Paenibacillus sp. NPDC058174]|uniref:STAS domain-containing protein n=1 Tax=Paenibacillus sp. NPDC058174 TaxID=3346366 RepID=UPI0036DE535D